MKTEKRAHVTTVDVQLREIRTLKAEKQSVKGFPADEHAGCETSRNRQKW